MGDCGTNGASGATGYLTEKEVAHYEAHTFVVDELTIALVMAAMLVAMAAPAFARVSSFISSSEGTQLRVSPTASPQDPFFPGDAFAPTDPYQPRGEPASAPQEAIRTVQRQR